MTLSPWTIYLWGIADSVSSAAQTVFALSLLPTAILGGIYILAKCQADEDWEGFPVVKSWFRRAITVAIFNLLLATFLPSSKTIAMMVVLPAIVNSEPIQKDLTEVYRMAVDALKDQLTPEKK